MIEGELKLLKDVYLGTEQIGCSRTDSGRLRKNQIQELASLGINADLGSYYHRGMVTAKTASGTIKIVDIHLYVVTNIDYLVQSNDLWFHKLIERIAVEKQNKQTNIDRVNTIYQMLGAYILPKHILLIVSDPPGFIQNCCMPLGKLTEFYNNARIP